MRIVEWVRTKSNPRVILGIIVGMPFLAAMAIGTEALVRARLDDELFASPTQIYARPVVSYPVTGVFPSASGVRDFPPHISGKSSQR